jgi:hypothetical protein
MNPVTRKRLSYHQESHLRFYLIMVTGQPEPDPQKKKKKKRVYLITLFEKVTKERRTFA